VAVVRDTRRTRDLGSGAVEEAGAVEVAVADQRDVDRLAEVLAGADAVYAIAPNVSADEVAMGRAVVAACRRSGVARLVHHSVIHPQLTAMPHHADKGRVEEVVIESGLDWTILQPNVYLQNLDGYLDELRAGRYRVPYASDRASAMVDLRDVAEVAARCLVDDLGVFATFELSGPEQVAPVDVARVAAELLGREVVAERLDPEAWAAANPHLEVEARRRLHAMFAHYDQHGSPGDATVLTHLLGHPPRDVRAYLTERLAPDDRSAGA
jgi:NAD(P)H dehydrogenase (quinone)